MALNSVDAVLQALSGRGPADTNLAQDYARTVSDDQQFVNLVGNIVGDTIDLSVAAGLRRALGG